MPGAVSHRGGAPDRCWGKDGWWRAVELNVFTACPFPLLPFPLSLSLPLALALALALALSLALAFTLIAVISPPISPAVVPPAFPLPLAGSPFLRHGPVSQPVALKEK